MSRKRRTHKPWTPSPFRVYCPGCGEVRGNERYGFPREHDAQGRVYGHTRTGKAKCPGGRIDPVKDRAP